MIIIAARKEISKPERFKRERNRQKLLCLPRTIHFKPGRGSLAGEGFSIANSYMTRSGCVRGPSVLTPGKAHSKPLGAPSSLGKSRCWKEFEQHHFRSSAPSSRCRLLMKPGEMGSCRYFRSSGKETANCPPPASLRGCLSLQGEEQRAGVLRCALTTRGETTEGKGWLKTPKVQLLPVRSEAGAAQPPSSPAGLAATSASISRSQPFGAQIPGR